jgi:hypothetical protein
MSLAAQAEAYATEQRSGARRDASGVERDSSTARARGLG